MGKEIFTNDKYINDLFLKVVNLVTQARERVATAVNIAEVYTKFHIGQYIVEYEQKGETRAEYGKAVLKELSKRLTDRLGDGWSYSTLKNIRQFYIVFSKGLTSGCPKPSQKANQWLADYPKSEECISEPTFALSWSHYLILMRVENPDARSFYEIECTQQQWSKRQLSRQVGSCLYERLALSRNKDEVMRLAKEGQSIGKPSDIIKNPITLEFLGLKPDAVYSESKLENAIINKMQQFLLELLCKGLHKSSSRKCCRLSRMDCSKSFSVTKACSFNPKNSKVTGVLITSLGCNKVACCWTKAERASLFLESPLRS